MLNKISDSINTSLKSSIESSIEKYLGVKTNIIATPLKSSIVIKDTLNDFNNSVKANKIFNRVFKDVSLTGDAYFDYWTQELTIHLRLMFFYKNNKAKLPTVQNLGTLSFNVITQKSKFIP